MLVCVISVLHMCYDMCVMICFKYGYMIYMAMLQYFMTHAGENKNTCYITICYNLFIAGGVFMHRLSSSKGENVEAFRIINFDDG